MEKDGKFVVLNMSNACQFVVQGIQSVLQVAQERTGYEKNEDIRLHPDLDVAAVCGLYPQRNHD